jgi:hypothetical protein
MAVSDQRIKEIQRTLEKSKGRAISWEEATEVGRSLEKLALLAYDIWVKDQALLKRLEESPNGFAISDGHPCRICRNLADWYDRYGFKCMICQKAIDKKIIPPLVAKDNSSWYSEVDLSTCFNLRGKALNSWIKAEILKVRTIMFNDKKIHLRVFLIKDNKDILPPKKLVESRGVKINRDGQEWFGTEPWYKFVDPHQHLKDYKIMNYIKLV